MIGRQTGDQRQLFYLFNLETRLPSDHLLRRINPTVTGVLADLREKLARFYSEIGRPSVDPELMLRMLIVGYCYGIRSERRLCEEVHLVKRFQTIHQCSVDVARRLALLFGIGTRALPSWGSRTRRNNLLGGLAGGLTAGPSGHTISPRLLGSEKREQRIFGVCNQRWLNFSAQARRMDIPAYWGGT